MKLHLTVQTEFTTIAQIDQPGYIPNIGERVVIKRSGIGDVWGFLHKRSIQQQS